MQKVCSSAGQQLCAAYTAVSNPKNYVASKLTDSVCAQDKQLCDAYNEGMRLYGATQNPGQYALQEVAKSDPKVGGALTQAYLVKKYMNILQAKPGEKGNDAATAANRPAPTTGKAVADRLNKPFDGRYLQESISSCLIGFSCGQSEPQLEQCKPQLGQSEPREPQIGDIKNCQLGELQPTDIPFIFNQKGINAKISGKGCTISKIKNKVYIYNSDSCSWTVDQWTVPKSAKGTYIAFDKPKEKTEMTEGRFLPLGEKQEFRFEDAGYEVPQGGVLNYKDGKFDLDLTNAKTKSFSLSTYSKGQIIGSTKATQLGKDMKIRKTLTGFEITGDAEVTNQFNRIISKGKMAVDHRGMLSDIGENSEVLLYPKSLKLAKGKALKNTETPEDVLKITNNRNEPMEFSFACKSTDAEAPSVNICEEKGNLRIKTQNAKGTAVSHLKSYTATKDAAMADIMKELKPRANKALLKRFTAAACDDIYNQALRSEDKNCAKIGKSYEMLVPQLLLAPGKKGALGLKILQQKIDIESGSADVTGLLGSTVTVDAEDKTVRVPMKGATTDEFAEEQKKRKAIAKLISGKGALAKLETRELQQIFEKRPSEADFIQMEALRIVAGATDERGELIRKELKKMGMIGEEAELDKILESEYSSGIGKKAAEEVLRPISSWPNSLDLPEISIAGEQQLKYDLATGNMKQCGCRRGEPTGKPVTIGMASGEACTAEVCSVTLESDGGPQEPKINIKRKILSPNELSVNGKKPYFRTDKGSFVVTVQDSNGKNVNYYIDKDGSVYLDEANPYAFGERVYFTPLNEAQKKTIARLCEEDKACKSARAPQEYKVLEGSQERAAAEFEARIKAIAGKRADQVFGIGAIKQLKADLVTDAVANKLELSGESLTEAEWKRVLDVCCRLYSKTDIVMRSTCSCPEAG